jgi:pimeloyl-ACP methyl ester carboxylesterase
MRRLSRRPCLYLKLTSASNLLLANSFGRTSFLTTSRALSTSPQESQTFTLPDSRKLGFATYGSPTDQPIFVFHGLAGSRLDALYFHEAGIKLNARIIGIDRPGSGLSTFQQGRRLLDWPADVWQLAGYLGIKQFKIIGGGGGQPYAIACAYALPKDVLRGTAVLSNFLPSVLAVHKGWPWKHYFSFKILPLFPTLFKVFIRSAYPAAA